MAEGFDLNAEEEVKEITLGNSFTNPGMFSFHMIQHPFEPSSVLDSKNISEFYVGEKNEVEIKLGSTLYQGHAKPCQRQCVLIFDHDTGSITLEKLFSDIRVRKCNVTEDIDQFTKAKEQYCNESSSTSASSNAVGLTDLLSCSTGTSNRSSDFDEPQKESDYQNVNNTMYNSSLCEDLEISSDSD